VHGVTTPAELHFSHRCEQIIATNRTVALHTVLDANMVSPVNTHAGIALVTVEVVDSQSFADSTQLAVRAVVHILVRIILP